ncbi:MAG: NAD(P)H-dependent glycerol-3-phosphate dehydrogenase [Lachnospiraceae bacterium]|nr:NAD(P)H-dependent glycerol-3-phosphate dehydrogenase [Lachnospiraceae bacterium]
MEKIGIVGAGSWGTAIAVLLDHNGHEVTMWSAIGSEIDMLQVEHEHKDKLPGIKLSERMKFTKELKDAIADMDLVVLAVPSVFTRSTAHQMKDLITPGQIIVNVSKGIEEATLMTMSQIIEEEIPQSVVAVLSGPSHAEEVGKLLPTTVVVGAKRKATAEFVQDIFKCDVFRAYISPDVIGIELGAALKNVVALAAGMADGLGYGDNTKAALITRGITEISRLGMAMGGQLETFAGLSGIGDLIVTCASMHSRNRRAGILIGQGKTMEEAMDEVKMVVEGVYSAKAAIALGRKYQIEMPIVEQVNEILFEGKKACDAVKELMLRESKEEHTRLPWLSDLVAGDVHE